MTLDIDGGIALLVAFHGAVVVEGDVDDGERAGGGDGEGGCCGQQQATKSNIADIFGQLLKTITNYYKGVF